MIAQQARFLRDLQLLSSPVRDTVVDQTSIRPTRSFRNQIAVAVKAVGPAGVRRITNFPLLLPIIHCMVERSRLARPLPVAAFDGIREPFEYLLRGQVAMTFRLIARASSLVCAVVLIGCGPKVETKEDKKAECAFVLPQLKEAVQDYAEYTGRTAAVGSVDIKARVTGPLLDTDWFREGEVVSKGQKLFQVDPKPYDAQLKQAEAQVGLYKAQVELTTATYEQATELAKQNPKTFSALQLRTYKAQMVEAQAGLDSANANLDIARLNKEYTTVTAPIDGVVGRRNQTAGNVILQDQTLLTTVVSLDRIFVYFDMDAPTYEHFSSGKQDTKAKAPVFMEPPNAAASSGGQLSQRSGTIDFFNNQFNPATDTLLVRGVFDNPVKKEGGARLRPGMFVRLKVTIGEPYKALVVPDRAILSKMGKKYLYVADENNHVKEIPIAMGQLQEQNLRVIKAGELKATDRVIVTRLLDIQPKQEIQPVPQQPSASK
jgi:multidrug efflux system membrane fusion protein